MKKSTFFSRLFRKTRFTGFIGCIALAAAMIQPVSAVTPDYTASVTGDINASATWGGTSTPVATDTKIWSAGTSTSVLLKAGLGASGSYSFYGGTLYIPTNGTLTTGSSGQTLTLNNITLDGGKISISNNTTFNLDLGLGSTAHTLTLNSGSLLTNSYMSANMFLKNASLAGAGTITIGQSGTASVNNNYVEFQSTVNTSGFTGTFVVVPGTSSTLNGGILKISGANTSATFGISVPAASGNVTSNGVSYTGSIPGKLCFNPGAGNTLKVTTLNLGGTDIAAGTYTLAQLQTAGYTSYLFSTGCTGSIQVTGPPVPTSVVATNINGIASVAFVGSATTFNVTPYDVTSSTTLGTTSGSASPVLVSGLTSGHTYRFTVTATGGGITSGASTASADVAITAPGTVTAVANTDIFITTTWSATSAYPIPVDGDANTWSSGIYTIKVGTVNNSSYTFYGGTLNIGTNQTTSTISTNAQGPTLTLNNITLSGGRIAAGNANAFNLVLNQNGGTNHTFTLNSGTLMSNCSLTSANLIFKSANLAGSGNITIAQGGTGTTANYVEFQSTVNTSGFTGLFTVAPGTSGTNSGGTLIISTPTTSGTFGIVVPATGSVTSNGTTYAGSVPGQLWFNPGAGQILKVTTLNLGGTDIAAGTYAYSDFASYGAGHLNLQGYLNSGCTGSIQVTGPPAPTSVVVTNINGAAASVAFNSSASSFTVTPYEGSTPLATTSGTASPILVYGLTVGHTYTFTVTATAGGVTSAESAASSAVTLTAPGTVTAVAGAITPVTNIYDAAAWSPYPVPVSGDANTWSTGIYRLGVTTMPYTFNGATFNVASTGTLAIGGNGGSLTMNNLTLNGGIIQEGSTTDVTVNLQAKTFTLNSGSIKTTSNGASWKNLLFSNGSLAGNGTITISQIQAGAYQYYVEFLNSINTSGFSGMFEVAPGIVVTGTNGYGGELKLNDISTATFGVKVLAANSPTSNGLQYTSTYHGLFYFTGTVKLTSLNLGGTDIAPGTYTLAQLNGYLGGDLSAYLNQSSTGTLTVTNNIKPTAPTAVVATAGNAQASVAFTAPASNGGSAITGYTVTSSPGSFTGTGTSSPITVTGLTNGTAYTFTVTATNSIGTGAASTASASVTPGTDKIITFTGDKNTSNLTLTPVSDISVGAGQTLTVDGSSTVKVNTITVASTGKLTLGTAPLTTAANGIILQSDASGTATLVDNTTTNPQAVTGIVNQYLPQGRNWYLSAPVSGGNSGNLIGSGLATSVSYWNEVGDGTTGAWVNSYSGSLTPGRGYIAVSSAGTGTNNAQFSGTFNTGSVPVTLTRTGTGTYAGFNLVANPYPSYLSWQTVNAANSAANMPTGTMWYRTINYNGQSAWLPNTAYNVADVVYNGTNFYVATTGGTSAASGGPTLTNLTDGTVVWAFQGSAYIFATVNALGQVTPSTVSNLIPPMQAFWVRTNTGGGTLTFTNDMRSHNTTGGTNAMKAPKNIAMAQPLLRLNVTNGVSADESIIYASDNASNDVDSYDAPKYFNTASSNQPEIYSQVGSESLAINARKEIIDGTEIQLGFTTPKAGTFSIKASQIANFQTGTQVILKDYLDTNNPVIADLSDGSSYTFSSAVSNNNTSRFSIIFKVGSTTTSVNNSTDNSNSIFIYKNDEHQISVNIPAEMIGNASVSVFNAVGQKLENKVLNSSINVMNHEYNSGVYLVSIVANGKTTTRKVVIN